MGKQSNVERQSARNMGLGRARRLRGDADCVNRDQSRGDTLTMSDYESEIHWLPLSHGEIIRKVVTENEPEAQS